MTKGPLFWLEPAHPPIGAIFRIGSDKDSPGHPPAVRPSRQRRQRRVRLLPQQQGKPNSLGRRRQRRAGQAPLGGGRRDSGVIRAWRRPVHGGRRRERRRKGGGGRVRIPCNGVSDEGVPGGSNATQSMFPTRAKPQRTCQPSTRILYSFF